jgi:hypothetical protein
MKSMRIYGLMNQTLFAKKIVQFHSYIFTFLLIVKAILLCMLALSARKDTLVQYVVTVETQWERTYETACLLEDRFKNSSVIFKLNTGYNIGVMILGLILSYKIRKVPLELTDSVAVFKAEVLIIASVVGLNLMFTLLHSISPNTQCFIWSVLLFLVAVDMSRILYFDTLFNLFMGKDLNKTLIIIEDPRPIFLRRMYTKYCGCIKIDELEEIDVTNSDKVGIKAEIQRLSLRLELLANRMLDQHQSIGAVSERDENSTHRTTAGQPLDE